MQWVFIHFIHQKDADCSLGRKNNQGKKKNSECWRAWRGTDEEQAEKRVVHIESRNKIAALTNTWCIYIVKSPELTVHEQQQNIPDSV